MESGLYLFKISDGAYGFFTLTICDDGTLNIVFIITDFSLNPSGDLPGCVLSDVAMKTFCFPNLLTS